MPGFGSGITIAPFTGYMTNVTGRFGFPWTCPWTLAAAICALRSLTVWGVGCALVTPASTRFPQARQFALLSAMETLCMLRSSVDAHDGAGNGWRHRQRQ